MDIRLDYLVIKVLLFPVLKGHLEQWMSAAQGAQWNIVPKPTD